MSRRKKRKKGSPMPRREIPDMPAENKVEPAPAEPEVDVAKYLPTGEVDVKNLDKGW
ncbi:MAG: hypothetical protein ACRCSL_04640 [Microbacterium sp.]